MSYLGNAIFFAVVAVLLVHVFGASTRIISKRSESSSEKPEDAKKEACFGRTPCGWAIYNRTTRYIDYFMKNRCACVGEKKCLRDDDDISIAAYVYRCLEEDNWESTS